MYTEGKTLTLVKVSIIISGIKFIGGQESHKYVRHDAPAFCSEQERKGIQWCLGRKA